jgi:thioglycine synthase
MSPEFLRPKLSLDSVRKETNQEASGLTRAKSVRETLNFIKPICSKIGVSRVSDITFLDKLYIPNYSAILPGTRDTIWVYSGKGGSKIEASASALMEAIERYTSLSSYRIRYAVRGSFKELSRNNRVLNPAEVVEPVIKDYSDEHTESEFLEGVELLSEKEILIPAELALYKYPAKNPSVFAYSHTNGLASGNCLEEAICHGLCEVIERDALSIADLCSSTIAFNVLNNIYSFIEKSIHIPRERTRKAPWSHDFVDDPSIFPDVDISDIAKEFEPIGRLKKRFDEAGIPLLIKNITQKEIGIPCFVASSVEWISGDYGYFVKGSGTHPDARVALVRAITELSQARAANIQGARDDLVKIKYEANDDIFRRKWQFMASSASKRFPDDQDVVSFSRIKSYTNEDILDDIKLILVRLRNAGIKKAVIVELTDPNIEIPVVRAVVPGLETFEVLSSIMGTRAKKIFSKLIHNQYT